MKRKGLIVPYQLGIYDWNGTLADDVAIAHACVARIFEEFAPTITVPTMEEWRTENGNVNFLEFYYRNGIPTSVTIDQMRDVWAPHYSALAISEPLCLAAGAEQVLLFCRESGVPNLVVSASIDDVYEHLRRTGVSHLFHSVVTQVRDKRTTLKRMVFEWDIPPRRAFYVNDTFDGIVHAREAGLTAIGFASGFNCENRVRAAEPHYLVHSFCEILEIIQG